MNLFDVLWKMGKKNDFSDFSNFWKLMKKKKYIFIKKKKFFWCKTNWATAQLYCEILFFFVLQYSFCIAEKEAWKGEIVFQDKIILQ